MGSVTTTQGTTTDATKCHAVANPSGNSHTVIKGDTGQKGDQERTTDVPCGDYGTGGNSGNEGNLRESASGKVNLNCHFK